MIGKKRNINPDQSGRLLADPYWFLEATVHREGKDIFNLAYRLCQDKEEATEIARAAFLKTLKNYRRFKSRFHIYVFLYRATFGIWKKRAGRMISRNEAGNNERMQVVRKGLAALPAPDNFIIVLRDIEGKSYLEIASIMKYHYRTVQSRLARARKRLYANILPGWENRE